MQKLALLLMNYCILVKAETISLDVKQADLNQTIHALASFAKINIVVSDKIKGKASLQLKNIDAYQALILLLRTNNLSFLRAGNIWYIAPRESILVLKTQQPLLHKAWKLKFARVSDAVKLLQNDKAILANGGNLKMDERTNQLFMSAHAEEIKLVDDLLQHIDVAIKQVEIEVRLVSIDLDCVQQLGVSFQVINNQSAEDATNTNNFSLNVVKLANHSWLDVKLAALESAGRAEVLSSPRLFTSNLQTASIESGEEVPYQAVGAYGAASVEFKKAVLGFKVTPQILPDERMILSMQVNQDRPNSKMVLGVPTISTRQIVTNILAKSGQTIVLGGVYEFNTEKSEQGLPYLAKLPVLGWLFKERTKHMAKRELLIFVKPKIL
jgi:type IV pilus assembly protein PilQ